MILPLLISISCLWLFVYVYRIVRHSSSVIECQRMLSLCLLFLGDHIIMIMWMHLPVIHRKHCLTADALVLWLFLLLSLSWCSLSLRYRDCVVGTSTGTRFHTVSCSLHSTSWGILLWSLYTEKKRFLWWEVIGTLICGYMNRSSEGSRELNWCRNAALDFPLLSVPSCTVNNCPVLQHQTRIPSYWGGGGVSIWMTID